MPDMTKSLDTLSDDALRALIAEARAILRTRDMPERVEFLWSGCA